MSTSTPPAWGWLNERYVPVTTAEESSPVDPHKPPDSATSSNRNGGPDPTGEDIWPLERAASTTETSPVCADQCPDCRCAPGHSHAKWCDGAAQLADDVINAAPEHVACHVESCPECGAVTDIDYGPDQGVIPKRETPPVEETFSVPFKVQEFIFEELAEVQAEYLHDILKDHTPLIVEMARDRFREGYKLYGSAAYQWDAETRLTNVLEELADAVVYLTSGSVG